MRAHLDLLWWRHRRPSVHVADYSRVVDMSKWITELDPDSSLFLTLLMGLRPEKRKVYAESHPGIARVGELVRDTKTGRSGKIVEYRLKNPDDWFSTEREIVVEFDTPGSLAEREIKHHWLEDQLFPRVGA